jgi:hypothetical protein
LLADDGTTLEDRLTSLDAAGGFRPMASAQAEFSDFVAAIGLVA